MADQVEANLAAMDELDFEGWNKADWDGVFARHHTDDVYVEVHGAEPTRGLPDHIEAMKVAVSYTDGKPGQVAAHPIRFGAGEWTCVVGQGEDGNKMVTVARWRDGAIAEEHIWM